MKNFQHEGASKINLDKASGNSVSVLRRIPADLPMDKKSLLISFNTIATIKGQKEDAPLVDANGTDIEGVDVKTPMGTIYTALSSIDGLNRLTQDKRILSFTVYKMVG